jgi:hypothetical protein
MEGERLPWEAVCGEKVDVINRAREFAWAMSFFFGEIKEIRVCVSDFASMDSILSTR